MRTYNDAEVDLAFDWVDLYFDLLELINKIFEVEKLYSLPPFPSLANELQFQTLRSWFFDHQDKFIPIWSGFWEEEVAKQESIGTSNDIEYLTNPFLMLYKPVNLSQLAFRLGMIKDENTWEPTHKFVLFDEDGCPNEFYFQVLEFLGEIVDGIFPED